MNNWPVLLGLDEVKDEYLLLRQVAEWLSQITDLLDPEDKPPRTGTEVKTQLFVFLDDMLERSRGQPILSTWEFGSWSSLSRLLAG